jgi:hypothetical protein
VSTDSALTDEDLAKLVDGDAKARSCTDAVIRAHWQQDIAKLLSAEAHFDNCKIDASIAYLRAEYAQADAAAAAGNVDVALRHLGHVIHSVEDFFAHTNFVELSAERFDTPTAVPVLVLWSPSSNAVLAPFKPRLVSGRIFAEALVDSGACPPDTPRHGAMNKDSPTSERGATFVERWHMSYYRATVELTHRACAKLLRETLQRPTWAAVRGACGTTFGFSLKVDYRAE